MASFGTINSNENRSEFSVLKAGWYHMEITAGEVKPTQNGGTMVVFTLKVVEGEGVNRVLSARFNIVNQSQEAARIGKQQLVSLADCVGIIDPCDTDPFIGKHVMARVEVRPAQGNFNESNEIRSFRRYDGTVTPSAPAATATPSAPSAQTVAKPSWLRK